MKIRITQDGLGFYRVETKKSCFYAWSERVLLINNQSWVKTDSLESAQENAARLLGEYQQEMLEKQREVVEVIR